MGKKQEVIRDLFIHCRNSGNWQFHNDLVKEVSQEHGFGNPFDATKIDNSSLLPEIVREAGYFIVHLGGGNHQFVPGIRYGYHLFEKISKDEIIEWNYRKSLLNDFDTSESNILSVVSNQRIIHDFLYSDIIASPKVYNARRTKRSINYKIGKTPIVAINLQMEIDLTMEFNGQVTIIEGKNEFPEDFAVYQLFHPFKYYRELQRENHLAIEQIGCCYILRTKTQDTSVLRLYNYTFEDEYQMASIKLMKKAEYRLVVR